MPRRSTKDPGPLARYMKQLRGAKDLTQDKLAGLAGYKRSVVGSIELGHKPPTEVIYRLAPHLGVTPEEILKQAGLLNGDTVEAIKNKDLEAELPVRVPVYGRYPYKPGVPIVDRMYVSKKMLEQGTAIEFYVVNTDYHVAPVIGVGDRLTVDRMAKPELEDFAMAVGPEGEVIVGRLMVNKADGKIGIGTRLGFFPEYTDVALVLEVTHRLKKRH